MLIKNRHYWSIGVHRDSINKYFGSKNIGGVVFLSGEWYETEFDVFVL